MRGLFGLLTTSTSGSSSVIGEEECLFQCSTSLSDSGKLDGLSSIKQRQLNSNSLNNFHLNWGAVDIHTKCTFLRLLVLACNIWTWFFWKSNIWRVDNDGEMVWVFGVRGVFGLFKDDGLSSGVVIFKDQQRGGEQNELLKQIQNYHGRRNLHSFVVGGEEALGGWSTYKNEQRSEFWGAKINYNSSPILCRGGDHFPTSKDNYKL